MKLEIGPGERKLGPDWTCVGDFSRPGVVDYICNWGEDKLPFEDGSLYASLFGVLEDMSLMTFQDMMQQVKT